MDKIEKIRQEIERLKKQEKENEKAELMSDSWILGRQVMLEHFEHFLNTLSEEPCKSLDEAAEGYTQKMLESWRFDSTGCRPPRESFKAGAEWQKSQMLKDAFVDNDVVEDGRIELEGDPLPSLDPILLLPYPQFKPGDKVRILVLKAEEE